MSFFRKNLFYFFAIFFLSFNSVLATAPATPSITLVNSSIGTTINSNNNSLIVQVSNISDGDNVKLFIDNVEVSSQLGIGSSVTINIGSTLSDGIKNITAIAYEISSGDASLTSNTVTYIIDTVLPSLPIIQTVDNSGTSPVDSLNPNPQISISSLEANSILKIFINSTLYKTIDVGNTNFLTTNIKIGETINTIYVQSIDLANNSVNSSDFIYNFNGIIPYNSIFTYNTSPIISENFSINSTAPNPSFTFTTSSDLGATYTVLANDTAVTTFIVGQTAPSSTGITIPTLSENSYLIKLNITDTNGFTYQTANPFTYNYFTPAELFQTASANSKKLTNSNVDGINNSSAFYTSSPMLVSGYVNKVVTGIDLSDFHITGGVGSSFTTNNTASTTEYSFSIIPTQEDVLFVSTPQNSFVDQNGQGNEEFNMNLTYDITPPQTPQILSIGNSSSPYFSSIDTAQAQVFAPNYYQMNLKIGDSIIGNAIFAGESGDVAIEPNYIQNGSNFIYPISIDEAGNSSIGNTFVYIYDNQNPSVGISLPSTHTNQNTIPAQINFSEPVVGFELSDIVITGGSIPTFTTSNNKDFSIIIIPTSEGTINISVGDSVCTDIIGNQNFPTSANIDYDITPPEVPQILSIGNSLSPLTSNLSTNNALVQTTQYDNLTLNVGSSVIGTASFVGQSGVVSFTINSNFSNPIYIFPKSIDLAGNVSIGNTFIYNYDNISPGATISSSYSTHSNSNPLQFQISFNEAVSGFELSDLVLTNATGVGMSSVDNQNFNLTISPTIDGDIGISIPSSVCTDSVGNNNTSSQFSINYDTTPPPAPQIYSINAIPNSPAPGSSLNPIIKINGLELGYDVTVYANGTQVAFQENISTTSPLIELSTLSVGESLFHITATSTDIAGNVSPLSTSFDYVIDSSVPDSPVIESVFDRTISPALDSDNTPIIRIKNLTIGNNLKVYVGSSEVASVTNVGETAVSLLSSELQLGSNSLIAVSYSIATGNASIPSSPFVYIYDNQGPTTTSLGNNLTDYTLGIGQSSQLIFNKPISSEKKNLIENQIIYAANLPLVLEWNNLITQLTIKNLGTSTVTFSNDVFANVYDRSNNLRSDVLLIDSALESNQLHSNTTTNVTDTQNEVVINSSIGATINVPSIATSSATINLSPVTQNNTINIPSLLINSELNLGTVSVNIPATVMTIGSTLWNLQFNTPRLLDNNLVTVIPDSGYTHQVSKVIEIGAGDIPIILNSAARILIPGEANKSVGYYQNSIFTKINSQCSVDNNSVSSTLSAASACYINSGSDLVVWTKHFTSFITYSQTQIQSSNNNNNNNSNNNNNNSSQINGPPVCNNKTPNEPVLFRIDRKSSTKVKLHFTPVNGQNTYYYVAFGRKENTVEEYGMWFEYGPYPGEISVDISNLAKNGNYFFKVRGGNGCAPGPWSNTLSIKKKFFIPKDWVNPKTLIKKVVK